MLPGEQGRRRYDRDRKEGRQRFDGCVNSEKRLGVMDVTAISMCMKHNMPIIVFNLRKEGNIVKAVRGEPIGTIIAEAAEEKESQPARR